METSIGTFKSSQFNEYLGNLNHQWVISNHLSGAMIEIDETIYELLKNNDITPLEGSRGLEFLKQGNFVVPGDFNEVEGFRNLQLDWSESARFVGLQIVPTLACNFRCPYCYENQRESNVVMSSETMAHILCFLEETIKPTTKLLTVSWYGGEPLLAMKQIEFLSNAFLNVVRERKLKYLASIVTNGYLLTQKNVDTLIRCNVRALQVTLDGSHAIHDKRRMLANGKETWQTIIDNLKYALSMNLTVGIRVNIDKENIDSIETLLKELQEQNIFEKVSISFGAVSTFGNVCRSVEDNVLSIEEAVNTLSNDKIQSLLSHSLGFTRRFVPSFTGCVATARNSVIIGPSGELYKCTKTIGSPNEICGHISKVDRNNPNLRKWEGISNLNEKSCQKCSVLPLCFGTGCAFDFIVDGKEIKACDSQRFKEEYVANLIRLHTEKNINR